MPVPYLLETPFRVLIEFRKGNKDLERVIQLAHSSARLPWQLQGRIPMEVWVPFMREVEQLAKEHPYTQTQSADKCCLNLGGIACFVCIGIGASDPDGGDYSTWESKLMACVDRHIGKFERGGCSLTMHHLGNSYWLQIDIMAPIVDGPAPPLAAQPPPDYVKVPPISMYPHATPPGSAAPPPPVWYPMPPPGAPAHNVPTMPPHAPWPYPY